MVYVRNRKQHSLSDIKDRLINVQDCPHRAILQGEEYLISKLRNVIQGTKSVFCLRKSQTTCKSITAWESFTSGNDSQSWRISCLLKTACFQDNKARRFGRVTESQFIYQLQVFEMLHCINVMDIIICYWYGEASIWKFFWKPSETVTSYILCKVHQLELGAWIKFGCCPIPSFWMVPEQHRGHP